MPIKTRRPGACSEVQILLGLSKAADRDIRAAALLCSKPDDDTKTLSRAEFIRLAAHSHALTLLKGAK